jgi:nicotinate-nucleotide adenylyltransferase
MSSDEKKKIGILGGTFNPIHIGHLFMAEAVKEELHLDKVIFLPCFIPPHKLNNQIIAKPTDRLKMLKLATANNKDFIVSDIELKRKGISYTKESLILLKDMYKGYELYFIIGSDTLAELDTWKDIEEVLSMCQFVVVKRPRFIQKKCDKFQDKVKLLDITGLNISASQIRQRIKENKSVKYLIPQAVEDYINKHNLYASS